MTFKEFMSEVMIGCSIGLVIYTVVFVLLGCSQPEYVASPDVAPTITEKPATIDQCPTGGVQIAINDVISPSGVICNGAVGGQGETGSIGPRGSQGPSGSPGLPGQDLTPITFIQFCPDVTPSYPSTFPEIGLCVANNLYAVYSDHGGFLVLVTPGLYSSDGINASCTFTVGANCQVSR